MADGFWQEADARRERQAHLLAWVRGLPNDVEGPAGMIKLLRHLIADMDAIAAVLEGDAHPHKSAREEAE